MLSINEKKHKAKVGIAGLKHKMVRDMEDFSRELALAKQNISSAQSNILGTIREKIQSSYNTATTPFALNQTANLNATSGAGGEDGDGRTLTESHSHHQSEVENLLRETEFTSLEELLGVLAQSEEKMFVLYNETQVRHEEMEKVDLENRHLEGQVEEQVRICD